jgi:hypothetical protein
MEYDSGVIYANYRLGFCGSGCDVVVWLVAFTGSTWVFFSAQ